MVAGGRTKVRRRGGMNGIVAVANNSQTRVAVAGDVERGTCRGSRGRRRKDRSAARTRNRGGGPMQQGDGSDGPTPRASSRGGGRSAHVPQERRRKPDAKTPPPPSVPSSSSPSSGQGSVAASTSVSAGSSRDWEDGGRDARGELLAEDRSARSSPSTMMIVAKRSVWGR